MKSGLEYFYSISVFIGVLATAYIMLSSENHTRAPVRALQDPTYQIEASVDPAVQQLIQMEQEIARLKKVKKEEEKRSLTKIEK